MWKVAIHESQVCPKSKRGVPFAPEMVVCCTQIRDCDGCHKKLLGVYLTCNNLLQVASDKQAISLLKQDKDFFGKQVSAQSSKLLYAEERIVSLNDQLDRAKQSREDLYDKYVASR